MKKRNSMSELIKTFPVIFGLVTLVLFSSSSLLAQNSMNGGMMQNMQNNQMSNMQNRMSHMD